MTRDFSTLRYARYHASRPAHSLFSYILHCRSLNPTIVGSHLGCSIDSEGVEVPTGLEVVVEVHPDIPDIPGQNLVVAGDMRPDRSPVEHILPGSGIVADHTDLADHHTGYLRIHQEDPGYNPVAAGDDVDPGSHRLMVDPGIRRTAADEGHRMEDAKGEHNLIGRLAQKVRDSEGRRWVRRS